MTFQHSMVYEHIQTQGSRACFHIPRSAQLSPNKVPLGAPSPSPCDEILAASATNRGCALMFSPGRPLPERSPGPSLSVLRWGNWGPEEEEIYPRSQVNYTQSSVNCVLELKPCCQVLALEPSTWVHQIAHLFHLSFYSCFPQGRWARWELVQPFVLRGGEILKYSRDSSRSKTFHCLSKVNT